MTSLSLRTFIGNNTNPGLHLSNVISLVKSSVDAAKTEEPLLPVLHHGIINSLLAFVPLKSVR